MADHKEKTQLGRIGELRPPGSGDGASLGRSSLDRAIEWIDAHGSKLEAEELDLGEAAGRVAASDVESPLPVPPADCAVADGFALRAADTVGAGDYNPLPLAIVESVGESTGDLPPLAASPIVAGAALPGGADAILPFDLAQVKGATLEVFGAVPEGRGIARRGQHLPAGARLVEVGRVLLPQDIGLFASLGMRRVQVVRRPRVRLLVSAPKSCGASLSGAGSRDESSRDPLRALADANTPMLRALVERDGGVVVEAGVFDAKALDAKPLEADLTLVAGRSGSGWDDDAARAIAGLGELAMHGIALRPGGSAGMGLLASAPVLLLPGDPLECWSAYEMLAGRLIRRMGGRSPELPYALQQAEIGRKIASAIGVVELCRVRLENGRAGPVGSVDSGGLASAVRADGFVVVPAASEGYAPGTRVGVYVYPRGV